MALVLVQVPQRVQVQQRVQASPVLWVVHWLVLV